MKARAAELMARARRAIEAAAAPAPPPPDPEAEIVGLRLVNEEGREIAALDIGSEDRVTIEIEHGLADVTTDDDGGCLTFMLIEEIEP